MMRPRWPRPTAGLPRLKAGRPRLTFQSQRSRPLNGVRFGCPAVPVPVRCDLDQSLEQARLAALAGPPAQESFDRGRALPRARLSSDGNFHTAKVTEISEPPLNTTQTTNVGDVLLRQCKYKEHDALYLPTKADVSWAYSLLAGYYLKHGEDESGEYYLPAKGDDAGGVDKAVLADPWKSVMAKKDGKTLCVVTVFNATSCDDKVSFEHTKKAMLTIDSFQQTLIYSGKVGNKINIGYRESSGNLARPAFNNNVEYDLSESTIIGYKGAQLEVIEATNQHIKYRVIRNFNNALQ